MNFKKAQYEQENVFKERLRGAGCTVGEYVETTRERVCLWVVKVAI